MSEPAQELKLRTAVGHCGIPGQGPFMIILLHIAGDVIAEAKYQTYGCPAAQACGDWVCEVLRDQTLDAANALTELDIITGAGNMPLGREHCPGLAITALRAAVENAAHESLQSHTSTLANYHLNRQALLNPTTLEVARRRKVLPEPRQGG